MTLSWTLRRFRPGDERGTIELLRAVFGKWYSLEYWKWEYAENPAGSPIIWLAESNGIVIGHYSVIPIRMKVGSVHTTGSFPLHAATHPDYRGQGILSSLMNKCCLDEGNNGLAFRYGFSNTNLGPTYKRYERLGHICFMNRMIRVLDWRSLLAGYLRHRFLTKATALSPQRMRRIEPTRGDFTIEVLSRFDERFDELWQHISRNFRIIAERDREYLNWRYTSHPEQEYTICTVEESHRILGYSVLSEERWHNLRFGRIVDLLGFQDRRNVLDHLVHWAVEFFKEKGAHAVTCTMSEEHPYTPVLRKAGFITHPRHMNRALYAAINLRGLATDEREIYTQALRLSQSHFLRKRSNWSMMQGDLCEDFHEGFSIID